MHSAELRSTTSCSATNRINVTVSGGTRPESSLARPDQQGPPQPGGYGGLGKRDGNFEESCKVRQFCRVFVNHEGPNLAKTKILAKYNPVNQSDRLPGGRKPAHAVRE